MSLSPRFHKLSAAGFYSGGRTRPLLSVRRSLFKGSRYGLPLFLFFALAACGGEGTEDLNGPRVVETNPAPEATGVPLSGPIQATFSSRVDPVTVNEDTFILTGISGAVAYQDQKAIFTPSAPLSDGTTYHSVLTTGIRDLDGVPLPSNYIWSFTTGTGTGEEGPDQTPPEVVSTSPREGATDVAINAPIRVVFSESIRPESLRADTFFIQGIPGKIGYDDATHTATLQPLAPLAFQTRYQATMTTGITDRAGNPLATGRSWSFTTGGSEDQTRPTVIEHQPSGDDIPLESVVTARFSKAIKPATLAGNFIITARGEAISAEIGYDAASRTATLIPSRLRHGTTYTVILTHDIRDLAGNRLQHTGWTFRTANRPKEEDD